MSRSASSTDHQDTSAFELVDRVGGVAHWRHRGNGLNLLLSPTAVAPVASLGVVYSVGSRDETTGQTGATHMLEHLMFKGTDRFNRGRGTEVARVLQRVGASFNATTSLDRTNYYETLPVEHLELAADLEADRMRGARVRNEDLESERSVVLNELDRGENEPFDLLVKGLFAHAYLEHTYHHPTIGWKTDVTAMDGATLRQFYDTYYHPDNATVIIAGDVAEGPALELVDRAFGRHRPAPAPCPRLEMKESEQRGERRFEIRRSGELGYLAMAWHIPEGLHPDLPALNVLAHVLTEGVMSRLHQKLVETNLCLGLHADALELKDPGLFEVFATMAPGVEHREVEEIIRGEVKRLQDAAPEAAEVARSRIVTRTDLAFHRESPAQLVSSLTEAVAIGDWRFFVHEMDHIAAVTEDQVSDVCGRYLHDDNLTVGWFVPRNNGEQR